jgi:hypothetical protein
MTTFTVEATSKPVHEVNGWFPLRRVTDLVPGTLLLEDADEPMFVMPVVASSPARAILFVDGVLKLVGVELVSAALRAVEDEDDSPQLLSPEAEQMHKLAESVQLFGHIGELH